ncbi:MAG: shikimate kinase [Acidimicrobiales bacterium]
MAPTRHIVLLGLMSSGKSSVGRRVAEHLGRPLVDGDEVLEARTGGRTAAEVADTDGIEALHRVEEEIALAALADPEPSVIGPAASAIDSAEFRRALAGHVVVWLSAPASYLAERAAKKKHRPLLEDGEALALFERQLAEREPLVLPLADLVVDVDTLSKDEQADAVVAIV